MTRSVFNPTHPVLNPIPNIMDKGFGRVPAIDFRDRKYAISLPGIPADVRGHRYWHAGPVLDQGNTSQCVAFAGEGLLVAGPVKNKMLQDPNALYNMCRQNDEWPGEDYDGTSVRGLMKVLKDAGLVSIYNWASDVPTTVAQVFKNGPVVFGTDFYQGMMSTHANGFVKADGLMVGGHAYLCIGVNTEKLCPDGSRGAFRIQNSWGTDWGQHGRFWLTFTDAAKLIQAWGEVAICTELRFEDRPAIAEHGEMEVLKPMQTDLKGFKHLTVDEAWI